MSIYSVYYALENKFLDPADKVDLSTFKMVGSLEANSEDDIYRQMNAVMGDELCCQLRIRSMSVGDVLVDEATGKAVGCCGCGWKDVTVTSAV